jgi:hypothetical protein
MPLGSFETRIVIMNRTQNLRVALALCLAAAVPAVHAASIGPAGAFTASGPTALKNNGIPVLCNATFTGTVFPDGTAQITAASFKGGLICGGIRGAKLPWRVNAPSTREIVLAGVSVTTPLGPCNAAEMRASSDSATGELTFNDAQLAPKCSMTGTLTTTPQLSIN